MFEDEGQPKRVHRRPCNRLAWWLATPPGPMRVHSITGGSLIILSWHSRRNSVIACTATSTTTLPTQAMTLLNVDAHTDHWSPLYTDI